MSQLYEYINYNDLFFSENAAELETIKKLFDKKHIVYKVKFDDISGQILNILFSRNFIISVNEKQIDDATEIIKKNINDYSKKIFFSSDILNIPVSVNPERFSGLEKTSLKNNCSRRSFFIIKIFILIVSILLLNGTKKIFNNYFLQHLEKNNFNKEKNIIHSKIFESKDNDELISDKCADNVISEESAEPYEKITKPLKSSQKSEKIIYRNPDDSLILKPEIPAGRNIDFKKKIQKENFKKKTGIPSQKLDYVNVTFNIDKLNIDEKFGLERNAFFYYKSGMYKDALDLFKKLESVNPEKLEYKYFTVKCYIELKMYEDALKLLNETKISNIKNKEIENLFKYVPAVKK
ncbi:tetratricopeptide repeat protein [Candidatus Dependentiae bacterium]|nr:tetratricopeptide repeat protein [Candidatus Dependentiae bacterium]